MLGEALAGPESPPSGEKVWLPAGQHPQRIAHRRAGLCWLKLMVPGGWLWLLALLSLSGPGLSRRDRQGRLKGRLGRRATLTSQRPCYLFNGEGKMLAWGLCVWVQEGDWPPG